jgi:hypothetical protein
VWRWVQAEGDERLRSRAEAINRLFEDGEPPPGPDGPVPEALTLGIDATGIHLPDRTKASAKLAVSFTASEPLPGRGKRRLVRRWLFADLAETDEFGMALADELERRYGAHRIARMMVLDDGEPWIEGLTRSWLPTARYQCDWWHVGAKVREFCRAELHRFPHLRARAFGRTHRLAQDLLAGRQVASPTRPGCSERIWLGTGRIYTRSESWVRAAGCTAPDPPKSTSSSRSTYASNGEGSWSHRGARHLLAPRLEVIAKA